MSNSPGKRSARREQYKDVRKISKKVLNEILVANSISAALIAILIHSAIKGHFCLINSNLSLNTYAAKFELVAKFQILVITWLIANVLLIMFRRSSSGCWSPINGQETQVR